MHQTPLEIYRTRVESEEVKSDPAQREVAEALESLYRSILKMHGKGRSLARRVMSASAAPGLRGLYIHGGVGRGKSMLMDLFYSCLPEDLPTRRVHFHEFMIEVHDFINLRHDRKGKRADVEKTLPVLAEKIYDESRVLCFDEFHVTDIADAMILGRLFTALFKRGVIVVATSNWAPERLYEGGLQRERFLPFIEILKKHMDVLHLDSPTDYRSECLMEEGSYFWPVGEATNGKMTALFGRLTGYEMPREECLEVRGRKLLVQAAIDGVARFTFAQLCEQPLGAEDYIKIAKTYDTVFIEGIPKMGYDRRNELKRFMTLIDVLYEKKTILIVSADALPEKLYYGQDHAFEFERTISRLKEMQAGYR